MEVIIPLGRDDHHVFSSQSHHDHVFSYPRDVISYMYSSDSSDKSSQPGISLSEFHEILACNLFPQTFAEACSEVLPHQMQELIKFQEWLKRRNEIINERLGMQVRGEDQVFSLFSSLHWRWGFLLHLYNKLGKLNGKKLDPAWDDRLSDLAEKSDEIESTISESLAKAGIVYNWDESSSEEEDNDEDGDEECSEVFWTVALLINQGRHYYMDTKSQEDAYNLCKSILDIEDCRKKANEEPIHLSEEDIKRQIELAERLPTLKVAEEIQDILAEITPLGCKFHDYKKIGNTAIRHIKDACGDIITIRKMSGIGEEDHKGDRCSVEKTLKSLFQKVDMFKERWERDYAKYFGNFDPTYPKRQRTE